MINRALAIALIVAAPLGAQTNPAPANKGMAQIVGAVLDSVNGGLLSGATVILQGAQRTSETDSAGRFRFDSVPPGTYQLGVFHPVLDALDISIATRPFHAAADSANVVILSVPSPATIVHSRCGNLASQAGSSAILGHVSDPETLQPVAGAEVSVAWSEIAGSKSVGIRNPPHLLSDTTDTNGAYQLCGLPSSLEATLKARRGAAVTGEIPVSL